MSNFRHITEKQLAAITRRNNPRKVHPLPPDKGPLPSLRGPRSPKGKRGGMTADEDKARRQDSGRAGNPP